VSIETDEELYSDAILKFSKIPNLELMYGDGFAEDIDFSVFVSNLPYSESKRAIDRNCKPCFWHRKDNVSKQEQL
jgi:16S rRNA (adenine1518-N6/adenine1519-N6)-dimethyltransferase